MIVEFKSGLRYRIDKLGASTSREFFSFRYVEGMWTYDIPGEYITGIYPDSY
jgi:hypothetical protein